MNEINDYEELGDVELPEEQAELYNKMIEQADNNKVKVIILQSEPDERVSSEGNNSKLTDFLSFAEKQAIVLPPDYKFNREEMNERS